MLRNGSLLRTIAEAVFPYRHNLCYSQLTYQCAFVLALAVLKIHLHKLNLFYAELVQIGYQAVVSNLEHLQLTDVGRQETLVNF